MRNFNHIELQKQELQRIEENGRRFYVTPEGNRYPSVTTVTGHAKKEFFAEWRKLRRPIFFLGTMGSVVFVTGLVTSLLFLLIDAETGNADRGNRITREMLQMADGLS